MIALPRATSASRRHGTEPPAAATHDLLARHAVPVPRYTSYPTANHFTTDVGREQAERWLAALPDAGALSLYLHIPYCRELCWYCGCATKAVRRYEPVARYVPLLIREIELVAQRAAAGRTAGHIHWGGGSPDVLSPDDIRRVGAALAEGFVIASGAEIAVETDPRHVTRDRVAAFASIGVNRVSIGVQDFDETVQRAIGRIQSFETTQAVVGWFRDAGVASINIDLVYGLPHQTESSVARSLEAVLALAPERIAAFGYAHLPDRLPAQRQIDAAALPGAEARFAQSHRIADMLVGAGYVQLGLDHFARPDDSLAALPLSRNFQGYTTDAADALIGLGASAISRLPEGYAQNAVPVAEYERRLAAGGLATARGWALTADDRMRAFVIERLMCDFAFSGTEMRRRFGRRSDAMLALAEEIVEDDRSGFVQRVGDGFKVTPRGRPFVRNICARFDAYLPRDAGKRRHALSV